MNLLKSITSIHYQSIFIQAGSKSISQSVWQSVSHSKTVNWQQRNGRRVDSRQRPTIHLVWPKGGGSLGEKAGTAARGVPELPAQCRHCVGHLTQPRTTKKVSYPVLSVASASSATGLCYESTQCELPCALRTPFRVQVAVQNSKCPKQTVTHE